MGYKFEKLEVWQFALEYDDVLRQIIARMPSSETYDLKSQTQRASTSISLNIAEGSVGQFDKEQVRFLGYAIRSLIETVTCLHLTCRRGYMTETDPVYRKAYEMSERLFRQLCAMRKAIDPQQTWVRESPADYG